ncbi:invertebrate-type lysozyme 2-like [Schistocerca serialis cubense]|uniref:invertebrate-type lysozyme 2-like n=1 Tax=Schistocerca serialis cubense TaxID=2023355 RepID=UPI00214EDE00|nr:invertebrate-type lysozyme 2-like [Schistocerca serialis cubense]
MTTTARTGPPLLLLLLLSALAATRGEKPLVSPECLQCICLAQGCDMEKVCTEAAISCGPFQISRPFWLDGHQPVIPGDLHTDLWAFERCADDPFCSAQAVEAYMTRYQKDCDSDGQVDCMDFMLIHLYGPGGCDGDKTQGPIAIFISCWDSYKKQSSNITSQALPN